MHAQPPRARCGLLLAPVLTLVLSACATAPAVAPDRLHAGRFVASTTQGSERSSVSGRYSIEVRGSNQIIELGSPIGTTLARFEIVPGRATVTGPQLQTETGADADALVERMFGWRLPVRGLADWVDGRPDPGRPARVTRDGDRITEIEQDGWVIRITEFFASGQRPRLLLMERASAGPNPAVSVRIVVDDPAG